MQPHNARLLLGGSQQALQIPLRKRSEPLQSRSRLSAFPPRVQTTLPTQRPLTARYAARAPALSAGHARGRQLLSSSPWAHRPRKALPGSPPRCRRAQSASQRVASDRRGRGNRSASSHPRTAGLPQAAPRSPALPRPPLPGAAEDGGRQPAPPRRFHNRGGERGGGSSGRRPRQRSGAEPGGGGHCAPRPRSAGLAASTTKSQSPGFSAESQQLCVSCRRPAAIRMTYKNPPTDDATGF